MACVDEIGLAGVQQTEVAQKLTLTVPIARFAGDDQRRFEVIPRLGGSWWPRPGRSRQTKTPPVCIEQAL
jgi:hypothetical protein